MKTEEESVPWFTVDTDQYCGIADKLLNRFVLLLSVGQACGFRYVHTPIHFDRSNSPRWKRFARAAYVELFLRFGIVPHHSLRAKYQRGKNSIRRVKPADRCAVAEYLGLDRFAPAITDSRFRGCDYIDINISEFIAAQPQPDLHALRDYVLQQRGAAVKKPVYRLVSGDKFYPVLDNIKSFLNRAAPQACDEVRQDLFQKFWSKRLAATDKIEAAGDKTRIVMHIRVGDRAVIRLPERKIMFHGDELTIRPLGAEDGPASAADCDRLSGVNSHLGQVESIVKSLRGQPCSIVVISDGYERTLFYLIDAISRGTIELSEAEINHIRRVGRAWKAELKAVSRHGSLEVLLGESLENTLASIKALATADVVIRGAGGFAAGVHGLYRSNPDSVVMPFDEIDDEVAQLISRVISQDVSISEVGQ